ncbi:NAD(P)H-binding protein [Micromonospora sp. NPDC050686]|uniref:NAD(P)H-binding protein n=1 Tax=Micromonospora sp. NPDC050686 TaxID=3154631 RepID=UPI0033C0B0B4
MTRPNSAGDGTTRVLVTGVRGKTGVPLAELLVARPGVEVLGGSSDPATVSLDGVRPTAFSWDDPSGWAAATDGIDAVYVVRPDRADAPELIGALLTETSPRTRVVLLSEQDADQMGPDGWAPRAERAVRDSGRAWTILRPSWFMQVFTDPRFYRDQIAGGGELAFPSGGARLAWIDARDIAAVAERALLEEGHAGQVYELTGPEALSLPRTAELLSAATERPLAHRETTIDEAVAGTAGFDRELFVLTFERVHAGSFAAVTDTVERVTGRPARTLRAFLADTEPALRHAA